MHCLLRVARPIHFKFLPQQLRRYVIQGNICEQVEAQHSSGTLAEVAAQIRKEIGLDPGYHTIPPCRANLSKHQPKPEDLPVRSMRDSFTSAVLPLGRDEFIRERYVNHLGRVRTGRLMEELDMFAVWLCHRHVRVPALPPEVPLPYCFVTLLVDKIEFINISQLKINADVQFVGHVSWAGRSSMEITIFLRQKMHGEETIITKAIFMMVARNATNTGPLAVNVLKPADELEQRCWEEAVKRQAARRTMQAQSIFNVKPHKSEEKLMYNLFQRTKPSDDFDQDKQVLPPKCRWMSESYQSTMLRPYPENRNAQNTVFGGYIMRNAVEISHVTASIYNRGRTLIKYISDISFLTPVKTHSFMKLTAYVVFTSGKYMQIMTVVHILDANTMEEMPTNAFYLTYVADHDVEEVLPRTYHETLWYLHGRRKLLAFIKDEKQAATETEAPPAAAVPKPSDGIKTESQVCKETDKKQK